jgi:hypothetical protein
MYPENGKSLEILLKQADMAMYEVKKTGRNNYRYYSKLTQRAEIWRHNYGFRASNKGIGEHHVGKRWPD